MRGDFVVPSGGGPFPGVCKFHGLPASPDQGSGVASKLASAGLLVLTFGFRGFRRSDGIFRLSREIEDAKHAVTHLLESELSIKSWVGVYGASYGGAHLSMTPSPMIQPAVDELLRNDPDALHGLTNPDLGKQILEWMIEDGAKFNLMNQISKISPRPLLVIAGEADEGIDLAEVQRLFELAREPKELFAVKGADHELTDPKAVKQRWIES